MEAMVNAVGPLNQPAQCNAGFVRENALLVVTFITDESGDCDDMNSDCSEGTPATWKQALVDAKGGKEKNIVMLGLFGDNDQPDKICTEYDDNGNGAVAAPTLRAFLESFEEDRRQYCSVCLPDYSPCFLEAVDIIDMACEDVE
jgi:hypothetical protein